jgi:hypothetical protein
MAEVIRRAGDCFRIVVATVFFLTPGMVFWFVAIGVIAGIRRWSPWRCASHRARRNPREPEASCLKGGADQGIA